MLQYDKLVNLRDFQNTLYEIQNKTEDCQEKIAKAERTESMFDHMQAGLALSDLEITMSNFAVVLREKFR